MINAEHLDAFLDLTERLSFTRVAEARHLSQPAIHLQIKKLEEVLGVRLYRREGRSIEITREGWQVARHAREVRGRLEALRAELAGQAALAEVVLAAGEGSTRFLLAEAIREVAKTEVVRLRPGDGDSVVAQVLDGRADLGVAALSEAPRELSSAKLDRVPLVVLAPPDHPLGARARVSIADLDGVPLIVPPAGRPHRIRLAETLAAQGGALRVAIEVGGWDAMVDFVGLGLGVAVVNGFVPVPKRLIARRLSGLTGPEYHLVERPGRTRSAAHQRLAAAIVEGKTQWRERRDTAWARTG
jgi:DNA-binding transcriptional LysR family regulator